jgi:hypothetical protein
MILKTTLILLTTCLASWTAQADDKWDINKLDLSKLPPATGKLGVTYAKDIRPLLEASCFRCHGGQQQKGKLRLDSLASALKGGEDGKVVVPGDSKKSLLVAAAAQIDNEIAMPPKRRPGGPGGPGGGRPPGGPDGANPPPDGPGGPGGTPPGASGGDNPSGPRNGGPGGPGGFGPPSKPLTAEQVGLIRAWIDQGAK